MTIHLNRDMETLHRDLLSMCAMVEELIQQAVEVLESPSVETARMLAEKDNAIDRWDVSIENECLKMLALHQPVANDLRRIAAVLKITGELERVAALGDRLLATILGAVPEVSLNGDLSRRVGGTLNLCFAGVDGEAVLHELDREGIEVSTGSACSHALAGPSHVLLAMGLSPDEAHASVRFSLGMTNDDTDVVRIGEVVPTVVRRLRALGGPSMERTA